MDPFLGNQLLYFLLASALTAVGHLQDLCTNETNLIKGILQTTCSHKGLAYVPSTFIPKTTGILLLNFNHFKTISTASFQDLPELVDLDLSNNQLMSLDTKHPLPLQELILSSNSFTELPNLSNLQRLTKLLLAHNSISSLLDDAFDGLSQLKELDLKKNKINSISDQVFDVLPNLETLDLSYNYLQTVSQHLIRSLKKLEKFYVSGNHLAVLPDQFFEDLDNLAYVYLYDNPWHCTCALEYFKTWLTETSYVIYIINGSLTINMPESVVCTSPLKMKGIPVQDFETDYCKPPHKGDGFILIEEPPPKFEISITSRVIHLTSHPTTTIQTDTTSHPTTTIQTDSTSHILTTIQTYPISYPITSIKTHLTSHPITTSTIPTSHSLTITTYPTSYPITTIETYPTSHPITTIETRPTSHPITTIETRPTSHPLTSPETMTKLSSHVLTSINNVSNTPPITTTEKLTTLMTDTTQISQKSIPSTSRSLLTSNNVGILRGPSQQRGTFRDVLVKHCCLLHFILSLLSLLALLLVILILLSWLGWVYWKYYRPTKRLLGRQPNIWLIRYSLLRNNEMLVKASDQAFQNTKPLFSSFKGPSGVGFNIKSQFTYSLDRRTEILGTRTRKYNSNTV
ncbi:platelet glycoprotein Ib alpha chain [Microcaecilia unicolor]|uniref:Platelet glycoprotein Ib alpha chain n=1 Tax=Microcaecilia unicolor TaxID=1415580 RepID=A0A6P7WJC0_9AMPH|nr:platelet glycoprotein Ib alpha chain [Microcaecilia unicolor]XP_030043408.1 platelet glycoprotein Ib alpha chain [Microcaecilia unicolor]